MSILSRFGLMRVSEHEAVMSENIILKEDCASLRKNLRQRTDDLDRVEGQEELSQRIIGDLNEMIDDLRPDAEAMRRKRQRDREQKAAKRGASS